MTDAKKRILARRARFMMAAVAGLGVASCGKVAEDEPAATSDAAIDDARDSIPEPCLGATPDDSGPSVCLTAPPPDTGFPDTSSADTSPDGTLGDSASDTGPEPCLFAPVDAGPVPCLKMALDSGSD